MFSIGEDKRICQFMLRSSTGFKPHFKPDFIYLSPDSNNIMRICDDIRKNRSNLERHVLIKPTLVFEFDFDFD